MPVKSKKNSQSKALVKSKTGDTSKAGEQRKASEKSKPARPKRITVKERRSAIANLLDSHGGQIYGFALKLCIDPELAETVVQEIFAQAYRKLRELQAESNQLKWLHAMAVNCYLSELGKQRGIAETLRPLPDLLDFGEEKLAEPKLKKKESREAAVHRKALRALVKTLPDLPYEVRIPLLLRDSIGYSLGEVSKMLGVKKPTVRSRLHRARCLIFWPVAKGLPHKEIDPSRHTAREWKSILNAKQKSLDTDSAFVFGRGEFCRRCEGVFLAMDYIHKLSRELVSDEISPPAAQAVLLDLVCTI